MTASLPSRNGHASPAEAVKRFFREAAESDVGRALDRACAAAGGAGHGTTLVGLVAALLDTPRVRALLGRPRWGKAWARLRRWQDANAGAGSPLASALPAIVEEAQTRARRWRLPRADAACLLAACLSDRIADPAAAGLRQALAAVPLKPRHLRPRGGAGDFVFAPLGFGRDLTAMARAGRWPVCPVEGLGRELRLLLTNLNALRPTVLTAEPGVGKTTLVYGAAWHLTQATRPLVPPGLDGCSVVAVSREDLLAGTPDRGALEKRLLRMFELARRHPDVILFFDEMHAAFDATDAAGQVVGNALKGALALGGFKVVGATTDREYNRHVVPDEALHSRLARIAVPEPDAATVLAILRRTLPNHLPPAARDAGITADDSALRAAVRLTDEYQPSARQPRSASLLLADAAADLLYALPAAGERVVTAATVARAFADRTGLPLAELDADPKARYRALAATLREHLAGQDDAIDAVTGRLARRAAGRGDPRRPPGRFLFIGPPGVGKSLLAEQLARAWLRDPRALFTHNLGGARGEQALSRLHGAMPGFIGYEAADTVFRHVEQRPRSVVVFEEADKADPILADALLPLLDGSARGGNNRPVPFSQSVVVLTANDPTGLLTPDLPEEAVRQVLLAQGGFWRAPLLDRIDRVLVFGSLGEEELLRALDILLAEHRRANREVPPSMVDETARRELVRRASSGDGASARRLEVELDNWPDEGPISPTGE